MRLTEKLLLQSAIGSSSIHDLRIKNHAITAVMMLILVVLLSFRTIISWVLGLVLMKYID